MKKFYFAYRDTHDGVEKWLIENISRDKWFIASAVAGGISVYLYDPEGCTLFAIMWNGKYSHSRDLNPGEKL